MKTAEHELAHFPINRQDANGITNLNLDDPRHQNGVGSCLEPGGATFVATRMNLAHEGFKHEQAP